MRREDYERLIDRETWAFIARTDRWYPPETADLPIDERRAIYDAMCRAFHGGHPAGVHARDIPSAINPPPGCPFQTRCRWKQQVPGNLCEVDLPPMVELSEGRAIRCHLSRGILERMGPVITQVRQGQTI